MLRRRPEAYHAKLVAFESGGSSAAATGADSAASIHDIVKVREPGLAARLHYDHHERRSGLVHILAPDITAEAFSDATAVELGDFVAGTFEVMGATGEEDRLVRHGSVSTDAGRVPLTIEKHLRLDGDRQRPGVALRVVARNTGERAIEARIALGFAVTMLGGGGNPSAWYDLGEERVAFDTTGEMRDAAAIGFGNDALGIAVAADVTPTADIWRASIETISISEDGFERTHQGSSLAFVWPLRLAPGAEVGWQVSMAVTTSVDRALDEGL